jgi:hypothetical protein
MSVEALWAVQFTGANRHRIAKSGGVLVVETGRVFGGDIWQWYVGTYQTRVRGFKPAFRRRA